MEGHLGMFQAVFQCKKPPLPSVDRRYSSLLAGVGFHTKSGNFSRGGSGDICRLREVGIQYLPPVRKKANFRISLTRVGP